MPFCLISFIYYRAEKPIRRVDATEKVLILHKTVQGKAYLYVLHYYILYVKTVFQCPRRVGWGFLLIFSCDEYIFVLVFQFLAVECTVPEIPDLHLQLLIRSNCHSKKNLSIIDCEFVPRSVFGLPLKAESLNYR